MRLLLVCVGGVGIGGIKGLRRGEDDGKGTR